MINEYSNPCMTTVNLFHAITDTFLYTFLEFLHVLAYAINFQQ